MAIRSAQSTVKWSRNELEGIKLKMSKNSDNRDDHETRQ